MNSFNVVSRQTEFVGNAALKINGADPDFHRRDLWNAIEQGDFINRPSRIGLEVKGAPGNVEEVRVGGSSVVVAKGVLEF